MGADGMAGGCDDAILYGGADPCAWCGGACGGACGETKVAFEKLCGGCVYTNIFREMSTIDLLTLDSYRTPYMSVLTPSPTVKDVFSSNVYVLSAQKVCYQNQWFEVRYYSNGYSAWFYVAN